MPNQVYKILLFGPQGSGKGTQAELLAKKLDLPALSMGQLLRDEIAAKTKIGQEIKAVIEAGNLVSDEYAAEVLKSRLKRPDVAEGWVLDSYPRNLSQFRVSSFIEPTHVIVLDVSREESIRRLTMRLTCKQCGRVYSTSEGYRLGDPCSCGGVLEQRSDDRPEAIAKRLSIYENDTRPMLSEYEKLGLVHHLDGLGTVEEVQQRIHKIIKID